MRPAGSILLAVCSVRLGSRTYTSQPVLDSPWQPLMRFHRSHGTTVDPRIITDFNRTLLLIADPDSLQASVAVRLQELFRADKVLILLLDPQHVSFLPGFSLGFEARELEGIRLQRRGALARWLLVNETPLLLKEQSGVVKCLGPDEQALLAALRVSVCVPLLVLNRLRGVVLLGSKDEAWELGVGQGDLLQALASQAGLAFENAALHREQRDRVRRLYRAERLASAGQLAAGIAHEIRNPLTSIRSTIQYVLPDFDAADQKRELLTELLTEVDRLDRIVNDLLTLTRPSDFRPSAVDLVELLDQSLLLIGAQARKQGVELKCVHNASRLMIQGDAGQLKQVLLNVCLNSLQAMPAGGKLRVLLATGPSELSPRESVVLEISDTGSGIPPEHLDKVFDPFFTLKKEGTGLGLSVSYGIVHRHEGDIELSSRPGEGTKVTIRLPVRLSGARE